MRRVSLSDSDEGGAGHSSIRQRKRSRPSLFGHYAEPEVTAIPVQTQRYQQLVIGDELEVEKFYYQRFRDLQQNACKHIGKALVKLVEPKKQTHFPYTRGSEAAPSWWPLEPGPDKKERVPHREPDHLLKPQRVRLLVHILRMVIQPYDQQHPSAQKLRLNVKKLEDAALEVMTPWFNDKEKTDNANKRVFFKEIFKVAKQEERFKNGEIGITL
ncbi:hypothetical protein B0O99DRAFT_518715 [Bisporella sp. PMI_857]|nr:hypothetical protein B0O99DRAFT_518715 [Bisporella sp. PMI_857]